MNVMVSRRPIDGRLLAAGTRMPRRQARGSSRNSFRTFSPLAITLLLPLAVRAIPDLSAAVSAFDLDGVKVIVAPRPASRTVTAGIFFRGGRLDLTEDDAGIEALLLASAVEGTEAYPRDRLRAELARMAAILDYRCFNDYSVVSVRCTSDVFAPAVAILADAALHPALDPDDVERVRARLIAIAAGNADLDLVRRRRDDALLYAGHPYAPPAEGTPETLRAINLDALRSHLQRIRQKSRLLVVVAGGVEPEQVRAALGDVFRSVPTGDPPPPVAALHYDKPGFSRSDFDTSVPRADVLFAAPPPTDPDFPPLRMAVSILQNRIFAVVRDQLSLSYDPTVELEIHAAPHGLIRFSATNIDAVARLVAEQMDQLRTEPVPDSLVQATAAQLRSTEYTDALTNDAQVARLAEYEFLRGGWQASLALPYATVTSARIQAAAERYFTDFQYSILSSSPQRFDQNVFNR